MRRRFRNKDIFDDLEPKEKSPVVPIIIFISIVVILSVIAVLGFNAVVELTDVETLWDSTATKEEKKNKPISSRDQMDLLIPTLTPENNVKNDVLGSVLRFTKVTADDKGYLITFSVMSKKDEYVTVEVKQVIIDGFYTSTTFAVSDRLDYDETGSKLKEQKPTEYVFRINKTELDDLDMIGFNKIKLIFDIETNRESKKNQEFILRANNDLQVINERVGLIQIDQLNNVTISYYKTVDADDATYIYFDFLNENEDIDVDVYVKQIVINNKLYNMEDYKGVAPRQTQRALYLQIPKRDFSRVNTIKVQFFLVDENETTKEKSFYITNEYTRAY